MAVDTERNTAAQLLYLDANVTQKYVLCNREAGPHTECMFLHVCITIAVETYTNAYARTQTHTFAFEVNDFLC